MSYLRFSRDHPASFMFVVTFLIFFPLSLLLLVAFPTHHLNLDLSASLVFSTGFSIFAALCFSIAILRYPSSKEVSRFVNDLSPMVEKKRKFTQGLLITTNDFNPLKIIDLQSLPPISESTKAKGSSLAVKVRDIYQQNFEGHFYLEFFLSKEKVKINIPDFSFINSLSQLWNNNNWRSIYYQYPELNAIIEKLPAMIKRAEIYHQDDDVLVSIIIERSSCVKNPVLVYNELVKLKKELIQTP